MHWPELLGYAAALCTLATFSMRTMVPLRCLGIASNLLFIGYGYFLPAYPVLLLHLTLLPINIVRLRQMKLLIDRVRHASRGDGSMEWLKPFMSQSRIAEGEVLFRKGDTASEMYYLLTGRVRLKEVDIEIRVGEVVGELGMLAPDHRRTFTIECIESAELLMITYDQVRELFFQNPSFGFYFLSLTSRRLFDNLERLEGELAERQRPVTSAVSGAVEAAD
ncbi:MAG TPA: cyclic nucleotide-binding domain-containing protein [Stellaceae bacterium]|nr:cyclic nucleotide-binding domain-containing protein [Stellaceae bacterium]